MSIATLDEKIVPILKSATDRVEIRDENGEFVGYFVPASEKKQVLRSPYNQDEIRDVVRNKGQGLPLAEALKKIGAR